MSGLAPPRLAKGGGGGGRGEGGGGKSHLKVTTGMFVAFLGEEIVGFGCSMFLPIWVSPMVVRKEILS